MSIGLVVRDASGNTVIDPGTFTVRLVEAREVNYGRIAEGDYRDVPFSSNVRAGMFAQVVPLWVLARGTAGDLQNPNGQEHTLLSERDLSRRMGSAPGADFLPCVPWAEVRDGAVRLHGQALMGSYTLGHVGIYVLVNI